VIVVVGGGWAGCAAAVELARRGFRVELHEGAPMPGGRARTVLRNGLPLDNGEHLLLGACGETLALAAFLHGEARETPWVMAPLSIAPFAADQSNAVSLRTRALPAPLGLLAGLLGAAGLSWRDRLATIRWFGRQRNGGFRCDDGATVAELLADVPRRVRDDLWSPLCVAALNTPPKRASAQVFLNVLREAFGASAQSARTVVPRHGLAAMIPERAVRWLTEQGHAVHLSSRVGLVDSGERVRVSTTAGERDADAAIVAVGPHQLRHVFAAPHAARHAGIAAALAAVGRFAWEPITTVYLGYAEAVDVPRGLVRLDDAPGQWLFDRRDILRRALPDAPPLRGLLSVVVSAHAGAGRQDGDAIATSIAAQLKRLRPGMPAPCWSQVVSERRATYACTPGLERPACGALGGRVYLAGDYTYPAFPATLEAAVRSGIAAARAAAADLSN
jgi:hydroxysqualene dehydroxylase